MGKLVPNPRESGDVIYPEYVKKLKDKIVFAYDKVRRNLKRGALTTKKYYDRNMRYIKYREGQQVMIRDNTIRPDRGQAKMLAKYSGPFWVIARIGDVNFMNLLLPFHYIITRSLFRNDVRCDLLSSAKHEFFCYYLIA